MLVRRHDLCMEEKMKRGNCFIAPNEAYVCQGLRASSVLQTEIKRLGNLLTFHLCDAWDRSPLTEMQSVRPRGAVG